MLIHRRNETKIAAIKKQIRREKKQSNRIRDWFDSKSRSFALLYSVEITMKPFKH